MRRVIPAIFLAFLMLPGVLHSAEKGVIVKSIRSFSYAAFTRIVLEMESAAPYVLNKTADGHGYVLSAYDGPFQVKSPLPAVKDSVVGGLEVREDAGRKYLLVQLGPAAGEAKDFALRAPDRIVIDVAKGTVPPVLPPASKQTVVVLDAGHGGKDAGIVGPQGEEKTIVVDLAAGIRRNLQKDQKFKVILTREKDAPLSLDERAAVSNAASADVFVSIHLAPGNSPRVYIQDIDEDSGAQTARPGTDFLGYEADSAELENTWGKLQAQHVKESGLLGRRVARALEGTETTEPVQAPMAALKSIDAPAVMIEIGLDQDRAKAAEAVARGIQQYAGQNR